MNEDVEMNEYAAEDEPLLQNQVAINQDFVKTIELVAGRVETIWTDEETDGFYKILHVKNCSSFQNAVNFLKKRNFAEKLMSQPFTFALVLECAEAGELKPNGLQAFGNAIRNFVRPIIVSFESPARSQLFFRDFEKRHSLKELLEPERGVGAEDFTSFEGLVTVLQRKNSTKFSEMKISRQKLAELYEKAALYRDILSMRFLHLFDNNLRPGVSAATALLENDCRNENLLFFTTIFNYSFMEHPSDDIHGDMKTTRMSREERTLILDFRFCSENLLLRAVRCKNRSAIRLLLNCGIDVNSISGSTGRRAADIAYNNKAYDILYELLIHDSFYPREFCYNDIKDVSADLRNLYEDTMNLHLYVDNSRNMPPCPSTVNAIVRTCQRHPTVSYFYNSANTSAAMFALSCRSFQVYELLLQNARTIGREEAVKKIMDSFTFAEREEVRQIHALCSQDIPGQHLSILKANSFACHDNRDLNDKYRLIRAAFAYLDAIDDIRPILLIVAASRKFQIIFDFERESVHAINPAVSTNMHGEFHLNGLHIYVGARKLLHEATKVEVYGTLAHELTHYAILLIYTNQCKPYVPNEFPDLNALHTRTLVLGGIDYVNICRSYESSRKDAVMLESYHKIIRYVFDYHPDLFQAELIVRVPQLIALYYNDQDTLRQLSAEHSELFAFYRNHVVVDATENCRRIEVEYVNGQTYADAIYEREKRRAKLERCALVAAVCVFACALATLAYVFLQTDRCLNGEEHHRFNDCWPWTRDTIADSPFWHQDRETTLREMTSGRVELLEALEGSELVNFQDLRIDGVECSLWCDRGGKRTRREPEVRSLLKHDAQLRKKGLKSFYLEEDTFDLAQARRRVADSGKTGVLLDEPLSGKTTAMKMLAREIKAECPLCWVVFVEMKAVDEDLLNMRITGRDSLVDFLMRAIGIRESKIKSALFEASLGDDRISVLIDDLDVLFPKHEAFARNLTTAVRAEFGGRYELWFAGRTYAMQKVFPQSDRVERFKLRPVVGEDRRKFFEYLEREECLDASVSWNFVASSLEKIEPWRSQSYFNVVNIFMLEAALREISRNSSFDRVFDNTVNSYITRVVEDNKHPKSLLFTQSSETEKDLEAVVFNLLRTRISEESFLTKLDEESISDLSDELDSFDFGSSNEKIDAYLCYGLMHYDHKRKGTVFVHRLVFEFYVKNLLKTDLYRESKAKESKMRTNTIKLFLNALRDVNYDFKLILNILEAQKPATVRLDAKFKESFRVQLQEFDELNDKREGAIDIRPELREFFSFDESMLEIIYFGRNESMSV